MSQFNVIRFINELPVSQSIKDELEVWVNSDDFENVSFDDIKQAIVNKAEQLRDELDLNDELENELDEESDDQIC